jgi:transcription antitermination factor NusG
MEILRKWHAVFTRPRWEKKVAELLTRKKIENYCPLNKVERQWSDRKKVILEPLFTSYVFVNIHDTEQFPTRSTDGVINFLYWLNKPAVIRNEEIDIIRRFLNEYDNIQLEKVDVKINDIVRVIAGPFMEQKGLVISLKSKSVKILLPSLGYIMYAEVQRSNVEIVTGDQMQNSDSQKWLFAAK